MNGEVPNLAEALWRAAASFSGGLCYLVVRRDLPPRKAVGVIVVSLAFGLFAADWVAEKTGMPAGVIGLFFGFGAIWVVDRLDDGSFKRWIGAWAKKAVGE